MKRLLFVLFIMALGACAFAQGSSTDYIYSPDGFVRVAGKAKVQWFTGGVSNTETRYYYGLYSKDLKVLVKAEMDKYDDFYVIYGTETIASQAFSGAGAGTGSDYKGDADIYIPSTVKYIAPDAFCSITAHYNIYIYDECKYSAPSKVEKVTKDDVEEKARYNIQGMKVDENAEGIQIIQYSDGTSKKVLVDPR